LALVLRGAAVCFEREVNMSCRECRLKRWN
jgi:hypothetical protein